MPLTTSSVHLEVNGAFREDSCGSWFEVIEDESRSVLREETSLECPVHSEVELRCSGVGMGGVEPTGSKEPDGHRHPIPNDGGEVGG